MRRWQRRGIYFVALFVVMLGTYTLVYRWGMMVFEGETPSLARSLRFVVETITTVGYGVDADWASDEMHVLATGMILTGVLFFFLSLPLLVVPLFEEALSTTPPTSADAEDHVVLCGFTDRGRQFVEELSAWDAGYVVVETDGERATDLYAEGHRVVHGDPEDSDTLTAASVGDAHAVVADADDETNASIALTAREIAPDATVVAFAEDPDNAEYIAYAGAHEVLTPRHLLGEGLAAKVTTAVSPDPGDVVEVDDDFEIAELTVQVDSEIEGLRLGESGIREETGADIIGAWRDGVFEPAPGPEEVLVAGTILLVAGTVDQVERLATLARSETRRHDRGRVVVLGHGEVGRTVTGDLAAAGVPYTVVDVVDTPSVDVVGDARDADTLRTAGVQEARAVIVALPPDTTTVFATLVVREVAPDVEVVARAGGAEDLRKLYLAGADYALSLAAVSGRMLANTVLDEEVIAPDKQVDVVRTSAPSLAGRTLAEAAVRERTGATVVAVQRDGELVTDLNPEFELAASDELVVAGSDQGIALFTELARG